MVNARTIGALGLVLGLGACATMVQMGTEAGGPVGDDACGASGLQALVGTSVGVLDPSTLPEPRRIIFPGQSVTMDFVTERLNVEIGADDQVARVYCG